MPTSDIFTLQLGRYPFVPILCSLFIAMLALCGVAVAYVLYVFMGHRIVAYRSPLHNLPGPKNAHWFKGNFVDVREPDSTRLLEEWARTYGHVLKYYSSLGAVRPSHILPWLFVVVLLSKSLIVRFFVRIWSDSL
jgi:hypothetical protein